MFMVDSHWTDQIKMFREQVRFFKYLAPYYRSALQDGQEDLFFQKVIHLWYDRFPDSDGNYNSDPDYWEYKAKLRKQVCYIS